MKLGKRISWRGSLGLQPIGRLAARIGALLLRLIHGLADRIATLATAILAPLDQPGSDSETWLRAWPVAGSFWPMLAAGLALLLFLP